MYSIHTIYIFWIESLLVRVAENILGLFTFHVVCCFFLLLFYIFMRSSNDVVYHSCSFCSLVASFVGSFIFRVCVYSVFVSLCMAGYGIYVNILTRIRATDANRLVHYTEPTIRMWIAQHSSTLPCHLFTSIQKNFNIEVSHTLSKLCIRMTCVWRKCTQIACVYEWNIAMSYMFIYSWVVLLLLHCFALLCHWVAEKSSTNFQFFGAYVLVTCFTKVVCDCAHVLSLSSFLVETKL